MYCVLNHNYLLNDRLQHLQHMSSTEHAQLFNKWMSENLLGMSIGYYVKIYEYEGIVHGTFVVARGILLFVIFKPI